MMRGGPTWDKPPGIRSKVNIMAGPKIWLDYDQQELDDQYNQRTLVPDANDYMARHLELSKAVRTEHPCRLDLAYGPSEDEILDIFPAQNSPNGAAPCVVYYHGGAWTRWHKDYNSYQAPAFTGAGVTFISVNFALVPDVDLDELIRQCRAVVQWVHANAAEIGIDPARLFVSGHSSGGHIAGLMAVTDWANDWGLPRDAVKGAICASGMYELEPARLSSRNEYMKLDDGAVARNSTIRQIPEHMPPMVIAFGGGELQEFRRQSQDFAAELKARGHDCTELDLPAMNHFQVAEQFADPAGALMRAAFQMMETLKVG